ncbi:MAG TPA: hypothetical protein DHV89_11515 [Ruminococcus sp.]|nr:hypothetical protein [Ruminococcus sp.]
MCRTKEGRRQDVRERQKKDNNLFAGQKKVDDKTAFGRRKKEEVTLMRTKAYLDPNDNSTDLKLKDMIA